MRITSDIRRIGVCLLAAAALYGCDEEPRDPPTAASASSTAEASTAAPPPDPVPAPAPPPKGPLVMIAGGDASFGRFRGLRLIAEPHRDDFAPLRYLFDPADLRFINLECTVSDQGGETVHPANHLVFSAPPGTEQALARAGIDIVSLANNHAWDYGKEALFETFDRLERVGVKYVGAGRTEEQAYGPVTVDTPKGKVAFVAVTAIWNQHLSPHPGHEYVADADVERLVESVKEARALDGVDWVVVSHHGGYEYVDQPHQGTRRLLRAAVDAGADAVIGHHPHVTQRPAIYRGKPILYSLGNLLMRMKTGEWWTEYGLLARLTFDKGEAPGTELCLYRIWGMDPIPLGRDPKRAQHERMFSFRFRQLLDAGAKIDAETAVELGDFDADGCARLTPRDVR